MEPMVLYIFQSEVARQCKFAIMAAQDLNSALGSNDMDRIWYSVQSLLVAAGNISKLLWPPKPLMLQRGEELRASLGVTEPSPLEPRIFRNHFEHFDERLEQWATSPGRHNFADSNVMPSGAIVGLDTGDYLRNFDPTTATLTFRGDKYELQRVIDAISELLSKASAAISRPWWENKPPHSPA